MGSFLVGGSCFGCWQSDDPLRFFGISLKRHLYKSSGQCLGGLPLFQKFLVFFLICFLYKSSNTNKCVQTGSVAKDNACLPVST